MNINKIDWESEEPIIFLNPRMPAYEKQKLECSIKEYKLKNHIFLATSGSTALQSTEIKWAALKKEAFLNSARAVNKHLNFTKEDIFLNTLPLFHVGGLSNFARAYCIGANIINKYNEVFKWDSEAFLGDVEKNKVTITSLVPTQLYDIVHRNLKAPACLKTVILGGGFLDKNLYERATNLNWPILPSYGMTECCSQIATALPNFKWYKGYPELTVLAHFDVSFSLEGKVFIEGESLLTGYIIQTEHKITFFDPKVDGKIETNDLGEKKNNHLVIYGRCDENIKISGENVSLLRLQSILEQAKEICKIDSDAIITGFPDPRQGFKIAAVFAEEEMDAERKSKIYEIISYYDEKVYPFERIAKIYFLKEIPRTALGKLKRKQMDDIISTL